MALTKEDLNEIKQIVETSAEDVKTILRHEMTDLDEQTRRYLWMKIWSAKEIIIDEIRGKKGLSTSPASRELHKLIDKMRARLDEDMWQATREYIESKIKSRAS